jgi:allantoicase
VSRVRLDIHPDGGLSRLRLMGEVTPPARERMGQRWLSLLGPAQAAAAEPEHFFS